jgi:hypothetical protein
VITNGKTAIILRLPPYGSCFIVFGVDGRDLADYARPTGMSIAEIKGPWTVSFPKGWGAPSSVKFDELISWTDHDHEGIKYFSGTASYSTSFNVSEAARRTEAVISLDLGEVLDVAEVFVNGTSAGILWTNPFRVDLQDHVREGANTLEIQITNMWINRLTGDLDLPPEERFCKTNRPHESAYYSVIGDETYRVQRAGLIGPVNIETHIPPPAP